MDYFAYKMNNGLDESMSLHRDMQYLYAWMFIFKHKIFMGELCWFTVTALGVSNSVHTLCKAKPWLSTQTCKCADSQRGELLSGLTAAFYLGLSSMSSEHEVIVPLLQTNHKL